jgi:hypothetical protein
MSDLTNHVTRMDKKSIWVGQAEIPIGPGYAEEAGSLVRGS